MSVSAVILSYAACESWVDGAPDGTGRDDGDRKRENEDLAANSQSDPGLRSNSHSTRPLFHIRLLRSGPGPKEVVFLGQGARLDVARGNRKKIG